jgi:formylglycine-generating enzyme required for sulfatase activity
VLLSRLTAGGNAHILADIYVLGFGAYELLAGRTRFNSQFEGAMDAQHHLAWMNWHADSGKRLAPLRELAPQAPQPLCELIDRMVRKSPSERVQSLDEVESGLRRLEVRLEDTGEFQVPVVASRKPARRRKSRVRWFLCALTVLLALCLAGGWYVLQLFGLEQHGLRAASLAAVSALTGGRVGRPLTSQQIQPGSPPRTLATPAGLMVLIPAGEFTMGGETVANEKPARQLTLPLYYLDRFEVTNGLYKQFCDRTGRPYPRAPEWASDYLTRETYPVLNVTWDDARSFCAAAGKRLPTEAEWEKAARGQAPPSAGWRNWSVPGLANLGAGGRGAPAPVGSYAADISPFGAADMAGNVHEWVADDYALYPGNSVTLPPGPACKVVRGGSYAIGNVGLSPHWRASLKPDVAGNRDLPVGFRCAADVPAALAIGKR